ncbi:MAG TPA: class A beta-lactamase-related serine hydrolase [Bacillota bacterium]|nr:class A beta-lactamase-related serine hydrolase [Bacillota bacterium]
MNGKDIIYRLSNQSGKIGFYYKNLNNGREIVYNDELQFNAASVIKLPIYVEIMRRYAFEQLDLNKRIKVCAQDILPSCGAVNLFSDLPTLDIRTLCNFMIALSDNSAANILIRQLGIEEYNAGFGKFGLKSTVLERLLFDETGASQGKENKFVPREIGGLLEKIYRKTLFKAEVDREIENTLLNQQINYKIPGRMLERIPVAHKTGDDDGISNDAGIVYAKEPFIVVFASNDTDVPAFDNLIRDISYEFCFEQ